MAEDAVRTDRHGRDHPGRDYALRGEGIRDEILQAGQGSTCKSGDKRGTTAADRRDQLIRICLGGELGM